MYIFAKKHKITSDYWKGSLVQKNQLNPASYTQNSVTDPPLSILNQTGVPLLAVNDMMVCTFMFNILKLGGGGAGIV
jgi:hypothetical protein